MDSAREGLAAPAGTTRAEALRGLRAVLGTPEVHPGAAGVLPLGLPDLDARLSGGLRLGGLHEIAPADEADTAAALGFATALLAKSCTATLPAGQAARLDRDRDADGGAILLVVPDGAPLLDGHGLCALGLSPERLLVLRVGTAASALAALEEAVRSAALSAVVGWLEAGLDLKASRRLQLAAERTQPLLLVLRPAGAGQPNAAATRWRVGAAQGRRDRFGCLARACWSVALERCRNGRPGRWLLEWDHAAHRLCLAGGMGDRAPPQGLPARASA